MGETFSVPYPVIIVGKKINNFMLDVTKKNKNRIREQRKKSNNHVYDVKYIYEIIHI